MGNDLDANDVEYMLPATRKIIFEGEKQTRFSLLNVASTVGTF